MADHRSTTDDDAIAEWVASGPGAGNGLNHVRRLFRIVYPEWPRGAARRLSEHFDVGLDTIQRVFKQNPGWTSGPTPRVVNDLAKVLGLSPTVVLFAFIADLYPDAVDEDMWRVLDKVARMPRQELRQLHRLR
jgi:hypothetical protein